MTDLTHVDTASVAPLVLAEIRKKSNFFSFPVSPSTSLTEEYFGTLGPMSRELGWAVIPQERDGSRMPAKVDRKRIRWGLYHSVAPTLDETIYWAARHFSTNVAAIMGEPSGFAWCLDVDVTDLDLSQEIEEIAFRTMGRTIFRRIGSAPKRALFYRSACAETHPANASVRLYDESGETLSEHAVEVLASRKMVTIYGRHHRTLRPFMWADRGQPGLKGPEMLPVVTLEQLVQFWSEVEKLRRTDRKVGTAEASTGTYIHIDTSNIRTPRSTDEGAAILGDDRKNFLFRTGGIWARYNAGIIAPLGESGRALSEDGCRQIAETFFAAVVERIEIRGDERALRDKARHGVRSAAEKLIRGEWTPLGGSRGYDPVAAEMTSTRPLQASSVATSRYLSLTSTHGDAADRGTAWVSTIKRKATVKGFSFEGEALPEIPDELKIAADVAEESEKVSRVVRRSVKAYVLRARRKRWSGKTLWAQLLKAPAGSGKTDAILRAIIETRVPGEPWPVLMLVPSYANAAEIIAKARRLDPTLAVTLLEGKQRSGEEDEKLTPQERSAPDFVPGCQMHQQVALCAAAGISTADMCRKTINVEGEKVAVDCAFRSHCRIIKQRAAIATSDLVVAVHSYILVTPPKELTDHVRLVVIDEDATGQLLQTRSFKTSVFKLVRGVPAFRDEDIDEFARERLRDKVLDALTRRAYAYRDRAVAAVMAAMKEGRDAALPFVGDAEMAKALDYAIRVVSRNGDMKRVEPNMSVAAVADIATPDTRESITQEAKFWRLIRERVESHEAVAAWKAETVAGSNFLGTECPPAPVGVTDRRIHLMGDTIRLAWRSEPNFGTLPLLILDASASDWVVGKVFAREIRTRTVDAPIRMRTVAILGRSFSKSSLLYRTGDTPEQRIGKDASIALLRHAIATIAAMHSDGSVVVCAPLAVENRLRRTWPGPRNILWMHYCATRGLNVAEEAKAAISIGCLNPSERIVDDLVAALTYDDPEAEALIDPLGTGVDGDDKPVRWASKDYVRRMRNGATLRWSARHCEGTVGQVVYDKLRQEELRQYYSRLRPIHRAEISTFYCFGSYVPEELIIDEVLHVDDLDTAYGSMFETVRLESDGVIKTEAPFVEEKAQRQTYAEMVAAVPSIAEQFFRIKKDGAVAFVMPHAMTALERLLEDGWSQIGAPAKEPVICRREGYDDDRDYWAVVDAEVELRREAIERVTAAGWTRQPGSRTFTVIDDGKAHHVDIDAAVGYAEAYSEEPEAVAA